MAGENQAKNAAIAPILALHSRVTDHSGRAQECLQARMFSIPGGMRIIPFVRPAGSAPHPPWARQFGIPSSPTAEGRSENQKSLLRKMNLDRRQQIRKMPDKFAFLQLERDDGGSLLDLSEGGLRFETFSAVHQNGPVHFWFSLNLRDRIEAWGELVWINAAKKSGGLRFMGLSEEARAQIREWISGPSSQGVPDEEFLRRAVARDMPARIGASEPGAVAKFVSKGGPQHATFFPGAEDAGDSGTFPILQKVETSGELVPMNRHLSAKRRQLILGLLLGTCISAAVAVSAIKYSNHRRENRVLGIAPTGLLAQRSGGEALPSVSMSPGAGSGASADIFSIGKPKKGAARDHTPIHQLAATDGHPGPRALEPPASNQSARAPHQPHPNGNESQKKASMTPEQLWASVQTGSSKAAVALADLYIKGEGVPQNCSQARVLLLVASEKRNAEAIRRLQELDKTGCPLD